MLFPSLFRHNLLFECGFLIERSNTILWVFLVFRAMLLAWNYDASLVSSVLAIVIASSWFSAAVRQVQSSVYNISLKSTTELLIDQK